MDNETNYGSRFSATSIGVDKFVHTILLEFQNSVFLMVFILSIVSSKFKFSHFSHFI